MPPSCGTSSAVMIARTPGSASARLRVDAAHPRVRPLAQHQLAEQHAVGAKVFGITGAARDLRDDVWGDVVAADESFCHLRPPYPRLYGVTSAARVPSAPRSPEHRRRHCRGRAADLSRSSAPAAGARSYRALPALAGGSRRRAARRISHGLPHARVDDLAPNDPQLRFERRLRRLARGRCDGQPDAARCAGQRADEDPDDAHADLDGDQHRVGHDREHRFTPRRSASCCSPARGCSFSTRTCRRDSSRSPSSSSAGVAIAAVIGIWAARDAAGDPVAVRAARREARRAAPMRPPKRSVKWKRRSTRVPQWPIGRIAQVALVGSRVSCRRGRRSVGRPAIARSRRHARRSVPARKRRAIRHRGLQVRPISIGDRRSRVRRRRQRARLATRDRRDARPRAPHAHHRAECGWR